MLRRRQYVTHTELTTAVAGALKTAKAQIATVSTTEQTDVTGISGRVSALEGEVLDLQERVATLEMLVS